MKILSIETSCDETSIALVKASGGLAAPKFKIIKNLVASQIEIHRPWGGVVPNLAKREHLNNLPIIFKKIMGRNFQFLSRAQAEGPKADLIAVTVGPGLEPCLWTGINFAKQIQKQYFPKTKIISVNHLHGHLYSFLLTLKAKSYKLKANELFPAISLLVSGGHTILLLMKSLTEYKKLGETRDDAAGEAFDKVARMLNLPYPGGPEIEKLAKIGNPNAINFPRLMQNSKNYDFSFSGLKTAVLYFLKKQSLKAISYKLKADIAASFQQAVIDVLVSKTIRAAKEFQAKSVILSGGVAANKSLCKTLKLKAKSYKLIFVSAPIKYHTDNAAMIAAAGYITKLKNKKQPLKANGNLGVG